MTGEFVRPTENGPHARLVRCPPGARPASGGPARADKKRGSEEPPFSLQRPRLPEHRCNSPRSANFAIRLQRRLSPA
ncbi:hypothetical protein C6Q08_13390 [Burkholderia multivorans]|nr:hypothetical protein C6Q08_13390 [Burkholderia multivorans]